MKQTILLIDDENSILEVASIMLEDAGYDVSAFVSAHDGIAYYQQQHNNITAILLDMTMTEMNGIECAQALWNINPEAVIILSSGYAIEDISKQHQSITFNGFLQKPYTPDTLIQKVENTLHAFA